MPAILCVCPHPDDEAFGPAGTIARYVAQGVPVDLLTFTRGQRGTTSTAADTPESLGRLREYETRASARVLGMRSVTILDYMDGDLDKEHIDQLAGHVLGAIEDGNIDTIIGFGPLGLTHHADHIACHHATLRAVERAEREMRLFYVAVEGEWVKQLNLEGPEAQPTHHIDISDTLQLKLAALACHSSQEDSRQFFAGLAQAGQQVEWFHRALPAYNGAAPATDLFD
jgi:LmbE family N-acetylglucosaminyl deacetylase